MKRYFSWTVCLLLSALGGSACQTAPEAVPPHFSQKTISAQVLYDRLNQRQNHIRDLKSLVKTQVSTPHREQSFRQVLLLETRGRLRLDTLNPFNQPVSIFILNGKNTWLFDLQKNRLYTGLEVWNMMYDTLGTVFDFGEYLRVFSGAIPRLEHLRWKSARLDAAKTHYVLEGEDPERQETVRLRLDASRLLPASLQKWSRGRPLYSAAWSDYAPVDGHPFPHSVAVARPAQKDRVTLHYSDPVINRGLAPDVFAPALPGLQPRRQPSAPAS